MRDARWRARDRRYAGGEDHLVKHVQLSLSAVLVTGALAVAACGEDSDPVATKATPQSTSTSPAAAAEPAAGALAGTACRLVTAAEAQEAIGAPVEEKHRSVPPEQGVRLKQCAYRNPDKNGAVTLAVYSRADGITSAEFNKRVRNAPNTSSIEPVDGVGDEALRGTAVLSRIVYFRKGQKVGSVAMEIVALGSGDAESRAVQDAQRNLDERLLALSRLAAQRL